MGPVGDSLEFHIGRGDRQGGVMSLFLEMVLVVTYACMILALRETSRGG